MSSARAAFLRQMGLSEEDVQPVPEDTFRDASTIKAAPASESRRRSKKEEPEAPPLPPARKASSVSTDGSSRAAFLAAMGISDHDLGGLGGGEQTPSAYSQYGASGASMQSSSSPSSFLGSGRYTSMTLDDVHEDSEEFPMPHQRSEGATSSTSVPPLQARRKKVPMDPALDAEATALVNPTPEQLKSVGNRYYDLGDFRKAVRYYSNAIRSDPDNAVLYSNRSAAYLQGAEQMGMDTTSMALRDAQRACEIRPDWAKAWSRKGDALLQGLRHAEAADCFTKVLELDPSNEHGVQQLRRCDGCRGGVSSTPSDCGGSLNEMVDKLNSELSMHRKMSGKDYLQTELEKHRLRRRGSDSSTYTPKADELTSQTGFTSDMARSYKEDLMKNFRCRKNSSTTLNDSASTNGAGSSSVPMKTFARTSSKGPAISVPPRY